MPMIKSYNIKITGHVQGVGFRHAATKAAHKMNVKGFVKNEPDGSVLVHAEGEPEKLTAFINWCHQGPSMANVQNIETEEAIVKGYKYFDVKY